MTRLLLYSGNADTRQAFAAAATRASLSVLSLTGEPRQLSEEYSPGAVVRAPGGLVAAAMRLGSPIRLFGPDADWFVGLGVEITGREWRRASPADALARLRSGPAFVKLADAKSRSFPARRFAREGQLKEALGQIGATAETALLLTHTWLDLASEYRVFSRGTEALTVSPYLVEDEAWASGLAAHRASFHAEAREFADGVLRNLEPERVPPAAALDVARLRSGRFVLLEANQAWSAAPYGCDPDAALRCVIAASAEPEPSTGRTWQWQPDQSLS